MARRKPSFLSLTDLFCGAGGASLGAEAAGLKLALGINHWQRAIETHSENFPHAAHDCRDVSETHPSRYGSTHLLWASPECPTWSQARGKRRNFLGQMALGEEFEALPTEAEQKSRVTMWDVVRYAEYHNYDAVVVENVVDLMPWYLLPTWLQAMEVLGYTHQPVFLNSMFFGVPQSRDRVYFVFWKTGNRAPDLDFRPSSWCYHCAAIVGGVQTWKNPAKRSGRYRAQYIYTCPDCHREAFPYVRPAAAVIDWSVRGERIGDRKKQLAPATRARIQAGIDRYWRPVVMDVLRDPKFRDVESDPLPTQTARQSLGLATPPLLAHLRGTHEHAIKGSTRSTDEPLGTVTGGGIHHAIVEGPEPLYVKNFTARGDPAHMAHPVSEPLGSITAVDHHALLVPAGGTWRRGASSSGQPMPTRTGRESDGVLMPPPLLAQLDMSYRGHTASRVRPVDDPMATVTAKGGENFSLVTPPLVIKAAGSTYDPGSYKRVKSAADDPLWTQTATNETALVVHPGSGGDGRVRSSEEVLPTQVTETRPSVVRAPDAFLSSYYSHGGERPVEEPMGTVTGRDRHALVEGEWEIDIDDCFFRMLMPPEIGRGMAFHDDYRVGGTQRERVQQYGQAVTPPVAAAIWARIVESLR